MSTLAACFGPWPSPADVVYTLLRHSALAADEDVQHWSDHGAALGVSRHPWQRAAEFEGEVLVARSDRTIVVSDATLYGTSGVTPDDGPLVRTSAAEVILRAWEQWGDDCARHLNGDYAFIVWDRVDHRAVLCRDPVGRRALYVRAGPDSRLAVSSRARALALGVEPAAEPNLQVIAAAASALPGGALESGYAGIRPVPAGGTMSWTRKSGLQLVRQWEPPPFGVRSNESLEQAALRLREVMTRAVRDRIDGTPSAIWLSGGADSTSLFAVALAGRAPNDPAPAIQPVSISYPEGDTGREDDHILALTRLWKSGVSWVDSETVSLFNGNEDRASLRDDPFVHTFGPMTAELSKRTRSAGARVAIDGYGGDALFEVSRGWEADLLMAGELRAWWRAMRPTGNSTWRSSLRWGLLPALPEWAWRIVDITRSRPLGRSHQYPLVPWLTPVARNELMELGWTGLDIRRRDTEGPGAFQCRAGLIGPHFARAIAATREHTVPFGVEVRSPLMDRQVIELAASRPISELAVQGNGKRLLKAAVKGIVPDSVLAPRPFKTGLAAGYLHRQFRKQLLERVRIAFHGASALGDHGLVEPALIVEWGERYEQSTDHLTGVSLYLTLEAEYWLRGSHKIQALP